MRRPLILSAEEEAKGNFVKRNPNSKHDDYRLKQALGKQTVSAEIALLASISGIVVIKQQAYELDNHNLSPLFTILSHLKYSLIIINGALHLK